MERKEPESSIAAETSQHVRAILEAAERSAAEMRQDAERQAAAHVARVTEAAEAMLGGSTSCRPSCARWSPRSRPPRPRSPPASPSTPTTRPAPGIIALNMALSGTPREETAAYLAEHYELADARRPARRRLLARPARERRPHRASSTGLRERMAEISDLGSSSPR